MQNTENMKFQNSNTYSSREISFSIFACEWWKLANFRKTLEIHDISNNLVEMHFLRPGRKTYISVSVYYVFFHDFH